MLLDKVTNIVTDRITSILDSVANEILIEDISITRTNKQLNDCIDLIDTLNKLRYTSYGVKELNISPNFVDKDKLSKLVNDMMGI